MKKADLNSKKIHEKAHSLQQECVDSLENNDVYITHFFEIEILEKLNYSTKKSRWTADERKQIESLKANIEEAIEKVVAKILADYKDTCLLTFKNGLKDYKSYVRATMLSMSKIKDFVDTFNSMDMERLEELRNILD